MCNYCDGKETMNSDKNALAEVYEGSLVVTVTQYAYDPQDEIDTDFTFDINYCPMCGRKLV